MNQLKQSLTDSKMILRTDRRFRAAAIFTIGVFFIWFLTANWRVPKLDEERVKRHRPEEEEYIKIIVADLERAIQERKKVNEEFKDVVNRQSSEVEAEKQKAEWHVNNLIDRMNGITIKVDKLARDVGDRKIRDAELKKHMDASKKKPRRAKLDRSIL